MRQNGRSFRPARYGYVAAPSRDGSGAETNRGGVGADGVLEGVDLGAEGGIVVAELIAMLRTAKRLQCRGCWFRCVRSVYIASRAARG
jgi:hypothetical protein